MSIVRLDRVRREIGELVILDGVTAAVARGERVGLVGPNGAGKTTLLRIIAGRDDPDGGAVSRARSARVMLLTQEANLDARISTAPSVRAAVRSGAVELETMELRLAELEAAGSAGVGTAEYGDLQARFEAADGYHLDQRVDASLDGLGIGADLRDRDPADLSGGEQTRVALARLLIADPELLLLDEPTNHLDVAAIEWLESALARRDRALLVASHDRAFLDAVVGRVWELRDRRVSAFRGDYSAYLRQREAVDARARVEAGATDAAIARERELVQRYRSQRKHVKMHEHERRLAALEAGRRGQPGRAATLALARTGHDGRAPVRSGDIAIELRDLVSGFLPTDVDGRAVPVTRVERLEIRRGERVGLVGPNGAGKTTLLRTIAGSLPPLEGFVRVGKDVAPAYLAQLRDSPLPGTTVLEAMTNSAVLTDGQARSYLARFLFRGDDVLTPVAELSGGERSRLELALMGVGSANLLLLDEPTNHLDIAAREALQAFLLETEASVIVVSHDRRLLEAICERLWVVSPGTGEDPATAVSFDGGYDAWRAAVADGWTAADRDRPAAAGPTRAAAAASNGAHPTSPRAAARADAAARSSAPLSKDAYRRARRRVERDLDGLTERKARLEADLRDPATLADFIAMRRIGTELADVTEAISAVEDEWLALEERAP